MKRTRILAAVLFYLGRLVSICYLLSGTHALITLAFKTSDLRDVVGEKNYRINFPFTDQGFLLIERRLDYIAEMIAFLLLYGLFFWLLANIFKTFREPKLFTPTGVRRLTIFYVLNFSIPMIFLVIHIITNYEISTMIIIAFLHFVLGVFAYFMAAIFRQGLHLQKEQDLYI
jgi:hypothetical protein